MLMKWMRYLMPLWRCSSRFSFNSIFPITIIKVIVSLTCFLLTCLIQDENRRSEEREWMGQKYLIHFFDYEMENKKYLIWGLTAGILIRAASVVFQQPPAFLEQKPNFKVPRGVDKDTIMP